MTEADAGTALSYEQARDELIDVVRRLEAGAATLEESLALWEREPDVTPVVMGTAPWDRLAHLAGAL
ncbi:exodeoxyribonuclease VII small subunit, partial [Streptomyces sp. URMC 129]|uniref:exodeoxyribonuclease VII small subunit n=1 Tax=Streptomyces sp. URMC 129 TaxID=3423407 RepID=UPI003F1C616F